MAAAEVLVDDALDVFVLLETGEEQTEDSAAEPVVAATAADENMEVPISEVWSPVRIDVDNMALSSAVPLVTSGKSDEAGFVCLSLQEENSNRMTDACTRNAVYGIVEILFKIIFPLRFESSSIFMYIISLRLCQ